MARTFQYQEKLPTLPIPNLDKSCDSFLEWAEPLLTDLQFENTKNIVQDFKNNEGFILQSTFAKHVKKHQLDNWSAPLWQDVYLKPRIPLIIEGNVFYLLKSKENLQINQVELATNIITSALEFNKLIDQEKLDVDM